jgi:hypothetical protein
MKNPAASDGPSKTVLTGDPTGVCYIPSPDSRMYSLILLNYAASGGVSKPSGRIMPEHTPPKLMLRLVIPPSKEIDLGSQCE